MSTTYKVFVEFTGVVVVEVEAESSEEAQHKALGSLDNGEFSEIGVWDEMVTDVEVLPPKILS